MAPGGSPGRRRADVSVDESPRRQAHQRHDAHRDGQRGRAQPEQLERAGQQHECEDRAEQGVGRAGGQPRARQHAGDAAGHDRGGDAELKAAEQRVPDGGRANQRNRLHDVGTDQALHRHRRVRHHEQHDHQRPRADRRDADQEPAEHPDGDGQHPLDLDLRLGRALRDRLPSPGAFHQQPVDHRARRQEDGRPHGVLDVLLHGRTGTERAVDEHTGEGRGDRARAQPSDQAHVDGTPAVVDGSAERLHDRRRDNVARHRGTRRHAEQQDEDRGHQRAAARTGHADEQAHDQASDDDL